MARSHSSTIQIAHMLSDSFAIGSLYFISVIERSRWSRARSPGLHRSIQNKCKASRRGGESGTCCGQSEKSSRRNRLRSPLAPRRASPFRFRTVVTWGSRWPIEKHVQADGGSRCSACCYHSPRHSPHAHLHRRMMSCTIPSRFQPPPAKVHAKGRLVIRGRPPRLWRGKTPALADRLRRAPSRNPCR